MSSLVSLSQQGGPLGPLYRNRLFRSDQRVETHDQVSREFIEHVLRWKAGRPDAAMYKGTLAQLTMYLLQYGAEVEVTPRPFDDFSLVHTSVLGGAEIEADGVRVEVPEGRSAVFTPRQRVRLRWYPGTQRLILKVPHKLINAVAASGPEAGQFLPPAFLIERGHDAQWHLMTRMLLDVMSPSPPLTSTSSYHADWVEHFEKNVALFLLSHQELALSAIPDAAQLLEPSDSTQLIGGRDRMQAVIDYVDSRIGAPISLEDLVRAAGVSARTLNKLSHQQHGVSPMELLRNRRLDAMHARLRMQPNVSVTELAFELGFGHLGRFAQYYRARFGELPRETQFRARR